MHTPPRDHRKQLDQARSAIAQGLQRPLPAAAADTRVAIVSPQPLAPSSMANGLPVPTEQKRQAQAEYVKLLQIYRAGTAEMNLPADDLGVALAVFVLGNYQVASGQQLDEAQIDAAMADLRRLAASLPQLAQLPLLARQELLEELAISGTLMRSISVQAANGVDPAALERARPAAQRYLADVLGVPYSTLRFTIDGMRLGRTTAAV